MSLASNSESEHPATSNFRGYLRIQTDQPNPDYDDARLFLLAMAGDVDLAFKCIELAPRKPVCIMTWPGSDPSLPSIMLYSHVDVAPVLPEHWKHHPFHAAKTKTGDIYGRGAQDMKCVGIQYLEAIRALKAKGFQPLRNVHVVYGPDEEIGGKEGMKIFIDHPEFQRLNVGFVLDEGLPNPGPEFRLFYAERSAWWLDVTISGTPGHSSSLVGNTAAEKLAKLMNKLYEFREEQRKRLESDPKLTVGDVISINMTMIKGGVQLNVIPSEMNAGFDIRIPPTVDFAQFEEQLNKMCQDAGEGIAIKFVQKGMFSEVTPLDGSNPWAVAFLQACKEEKLELKTEIFPVSSDCRFVRSKGIPALGFCPINNTPALLHSHNEYLNEKVFLRGIEIYEAVISHVANVKV